MGRWKLFLILVLAVVLLHILIIKIFFIGSGDETFVSSEKQENKEAVSVMAEPQIPQHIRKK
ncbi:MAG: hypothetical protein IKA22_00010 [Lentisphaeria bacterium]|nr:hypothetical protein [Lentisphaeria bacterium]